MINNDVVGKYIYLNIYFYVKIIIMIKRERERGGGEGRKGRRKLHWIFRFRVYFPFS